MPCSANASNRMTHPAAQKYTLLYLYANWRCTVFGERS